MGQKWEKQATEREKPHDEGMGAILLIYCYNKLIEITGKRLAIFQWDASRTC